MKNTYTIKKNKVFRYIFKRGDYYKGKSIIIHTCKTKYATEKGDDKNFFAVCVSKKNGKSHQRNKLKRWVREVYKEEESKIKGGYNIIIVYKKSITVNDVDFSSIKTDMQECFKELKLYEIN